MFTYVQFEIVSAIVFALLLALLVYTKRKNVTVQKAFFPVYLVMWRTKIGLLQMEKYGKKYQGIVRLFGYFSIGIGVLGIVLMFVMLVISVILPFFKPEVGGGVTLALPGFNIPGLGMLGFWHWTISILVLVVVHEFSHGIVAVAHGLQIKNSGPAIFGIFLPIGKKIFWGGYILPVIPAAYVEPDEKEMEKKSDAVRYSIISAGPVSNIVLGSIFLIIFLFIFAPIENNMTTPIGVNLYSQDSNNSIFGDMRNGIFLDSIDGKVLDNPSTFNSVILKKKPGDSILFSGKNQTYNLTLVPSQIDPEMASSGIKGSLVQERVYKEKTKGSIFAWFKNLIKWLAALNLLIGIANLLPLGPVDGGQMLLVFLQNTISDKKKVMKWRSMISGLTLFLILFGLFYSFSGWVGGLF